MYKKLLFLMCAFLLGQDNALNEGIKYYENRADGASGLIANDKNILKSITFFEKLLNSTHDRDAAIYLIKSYYYMAQYVALDYSDKVFYFELALTLSNQYIYKYPDSVDFIYWNLATMSNWAKTVGLRSVTKMGAGEEFREKAVDVIVMDPEYENGGGYFLLGAVYFTAPYIPLISSWPSNTKSIKYFKQAVATGLATPLQQIYHAKSLINDKKMDEAKKILKNLSKMNPNPKNLIEDKTYIEEAKILLKEKF